MNWLTVCKLNSQQLIDDFENSINSWNKASKFQQIWGALFCLVLILVFTVPDIWQDLIQDITKESCTVQNINFQI